MDQKFALLLLVLPVVSGYHTGAPLEACGHMTPPHKGVAPQNTTSPFSVLVSNVTYEYGKPITVTIVGPAFKGVLLQVRKVSGSDKPVGTFSQLPANTRFLNCSAPTDSLTHSNANMKINISASWMPPASQQGEVHFLATVVKEKIIFWVKIPSVKLLPRSPYPGPTTTPSTTTQASTTKRSSASFVSEERLFFCVALLGAIVMQRM